MKTLPGAVQGGDNDGSCEASPVWFLWARGRLLMHLGQDSADPGGVWHGMGPAPAPQPYVEPACGENTPTANFSHPLEGFFSILVWIRPAGNCEVSPHYWLFHKPKNLRGVWPSAFLEWSLPSPAWLPKAAFVFPCFYYIKLSCFEFCLVVGVFFKW